MVEGGRKGGGEKRGKGKIFEWRSRSVAGLWAGLDESRRLDARVDVITFTMRSDPILFASRGKCCQGLRLSEHRADQSERNSILNK